MTQVQMKENLISELGEQFVQDTTGINNGFPILSWQKYKRIRRVSHNR